MRELLIDVDQPDEYMLNYIHDKIAAPVKATGGLLALTNKGGRTKLGIAVKDECFNQINKAVKGVTAEVLAIGYKNRYLKEKIKIESDSLLGKTLINTMCVFDSNYDTNYIKRKINDLDVLALDGCYNFRLIDVKKKWNEVVDLSNNYSGFLSERSVLYEFLSFLLDAIPCLSDTVTVVLDSEKKSFEMFNVKEKLMLKFSTFPDNYDVREQILFNLVCFNPNLVRFCGDMEGLGVEFCEIINELFNVKEFLGVNV